MKHVTSALLASVLAAGTLVVPAAAASADYNIYTFDEYQFSCAVPTKLSVFTQDMDESDPLFQEFSITYEQEMEILTGNDNNYILNVVDDYVTFDLYLNVYDASEDEMANFTDMNEDELAVFCQMVELGLTSSGADVGKAEMTEINGIDYAYFEYSLSDDEGEYSGCEYFTVQNGWEFIYVMDSYMDGVTSTQNAMMTELLNTVTYDGTEAVAPSATETAPTESVPAESAPVEAPVQTPEESAALETPAESQALVEAGSDLEPDSSAAVGNVTNAFAIGAIIGSLVVGALCGLIPLIVGLVKKQKVLAIVGMVVCIVCGFLLGILLALPAAIIFLIVILVRANSAKKKAAAQAAAQVPPADPWNAGNNGNDPWNSQNNSGNSWN